MAIEKPIGIALIVCEQIIQDTPSGKLSLVGIFNSIQAESFPTTVKHLCVFARLTNINGNIPLELRCSDETHEDPITTIPFNATLDNPNDVVDVAFELDEFSFPRPGLYCFEIQAADEGIILFTRLNLLQVVKK